MRRGTLKKFHKPFFFILLACAVAAAPAAGGKKEVSLSPHEEEVAGKTGFDRQVLLIVKAETGEHIHRLTGYDENGYRIIADGICVTVPEDKSEVHLFALKKKLRPMKYGAFVVELNEGMKTETIGILKSADPYDILRVMQTSGDDYDIENQDVIDTLKEWEKDCQFEIIGADSDWVELEFIRLPKDMKAFVEEVKDFCPDAVDPGARGVDDLVEEIQKTKRLSLWWQE